MQQTLLIFAVFFSLSGCDATPPESKGVSGKSANPPANIYIADSDPARVEFEKALDLIHGFNWSDDQHLRARAFVENMGLAYPNSPYPLIAQAEYEHRVWRSRGGGSPEQIRALIKKAFPKARGIADTYVTLAKLELDQGLITPAVTNAEQAFKLAPDKPEVRYVMARAAEARKEFESAEQHYRKYIEVSRKPIRQSNVLISMAEMFLRVVPANVEKADEAFQSAIKLDPGAPWKLHNYAKFLLDYRADYEGALSYIHDAQNIMAHPQFRELASLSMYAKWADGHANQWANFKPRDDRTPPKGRPAIEDLKKLSESTGIAIDDAYVELAGSPALGYAVRALVNEKMVSNIDVKTVGSCGCTALIKSADANNLELAKFLVASKANVNGVNANGESALTRFILFKNWEAIGYLIAHGARVNFIDKQGYSPLHVIDQFADGDSVGYKLLLERKADATLPLPSGFSLLSQAIMRQRADLVRLLVKYGADPNELFSFVPNQRRALIALATDRGGIEIVKILIDAGADTFVIDDFELRVLEKTKPEIHQLITKSRVERDRQAPEKP